MKKLIGILTSLVVSVFLVVNTASANEGSIALANSGVACEGVSIWQESSYKVSGRCDGLVYPYSTQYEHYVLWATQTDGNIVRVDDIDRGNFEGSVTDSFSNIFITAEGTSGPRRPSTFEIVRGEIDPFSFDKSQDTAPEPTIAPAASAKATSDAAVSTANTTVGSVVGKILKSLLVIVFVVIIIAVVASLLFRRRGSISS